ncbi:YutD family protein [Hydrogenibacillus schlegelii]|uniref:YutD family protein n=1 Tax=Hydrogenibacillus schlegelii TaxID=1484 RepID=UPI001FE0A695|nr:YutD family protein [Hydrogenibacillus schlegelii]
MMALKEDKPSPAPPAAGAAASEAGRRLVHLSHGVFEVVLDVRGGWNAEAFRARYQDVLNKYDYIVGDWSYDQLRLKGFYSDKNKGVPPEQRISALDHYVQEYCNFGCRYFVVRRLKPGRGG